MSSPVDDDWSVLVLRVWFEDRTDGFRARLMIRQLEGPPVTAVFSRPDDVITAVRRWMDGVMTG